MSLEKRLGAMLLAVSMCAAMSVSSYAAEPNVKVSTNAAGETVYTQTVKVQLNSAYALENSRTVRANQNLSLALDPGKTGGSSLISFRFSSLPSNAKVRSVQIDPGKGIANAGNKKILGVVKFSQFTIVSPMGKSSVLPWNSNGMKDETTFLNQDGQGTWMAKVYGTNVTRPTGNYMTDLLSIGTLSYKSVEMTISYVLE